MLKMARINLNLKPHLISILISALQVEGVVWGETRKETYAEKNLIWFLLESGLTFLFLTKELTRTSATFQNSKNAWARQRFQSFTLIKNYSSLYVVFHEPEMSVREREKERET